MKHKEYALCTLALGPRYALFARHLAETLRIMNPDKMLFVATDQESIFNGLTNVVSLPHVQKGIWHCYHDKRYAARAALESHDAVLFVDADTIVKTPLPKTILAAPGLTPVFCKGFHAQIENYLLPRLRVKLESILDRLHVDPSMLTFPMDNLWLIVRITDTNRDS